MAQAEKAVSTADEAKSKRMAQHVRRASVEEVKRMAKAAQLAEADEDKAHSKRENRVREFRKNFASHAVDQEQKVSSV